MKPYYQDHHTTLYNKDCRAMAELPDDSIQCLVTSPPYWGLRKYSGVPDLIWGDSGCQHQWGETLISKANDRNRGSMEWKTGGNPAAKVLGEKVAQGNTCSLCGAWKGSYGLEPTPEMYIEHTIEILREIRRVLRKDGCVFLNLGDSYAGSGSPGGDFRNGKGGDDYLRPYNRKGGVLKPKDLCLIPFRVAIAAQEDGWWVRSVIIWSKPNPMPESVTDRPTESHEYILLLTKSAKYYWDADAVRTGYQQSSIDRADGSKVTTSNPDRPVGFTRDLANGANLKSVWTFPTQPYPEAHFAVFPEKLPELCIKAATPEVGCCSKCGAPWERITEGAPVATQPFRSKRYTNQGYAPDNSSHQGKEWFKPSEGVKTLGWQPTCKCWEYAKDLPIVDGVGFKQPYPQVPSVVLDPFAGAGTTLWVAKTLNRQAIGYELSEEYCWLAMDRNKQQAMSI